MNKKQRRDLEKIRDISRLANVSGVHRETVGKFVEGYAKLYEDAIARKIPLVNMTLKHSRVSSGYTDIQLSYVVILEGRVKIWGIEIPGVFIRPSLHINTNEETGEIYTFDVSVRVMQRNGAIPRHPHNLSTESDGTPICIGPSLSSLLYRNPESLIAVAIAAACNVSSHGYGRMDRIAEAAGVRTPTYVRRYLSYE